MDMTVSTASPTIAGETHRRQFALGEETVGYVYDRYQAADRDSAVVCVHGITRNRHDFTYLARYLSDRFDVYAPDLLGHGDSDWFEGRVVYEKEMFLAQLLDLMSDLRGRRIGYVGSSYGGLMGIRLAARPDSPIGCLVLNEAGVGIRQEFYEKTARNISYYPLFGSMNSVVSWMKLVMRNSGDLAPERFDEIVRHSVRQTPAGEYVLAYDKDIPRVWLGNHGRRPEPWTLWESIRCPVLLIRGAHSEVVTPDVAAQMKERKPDMELIEIEEAGHFPHLMSLSQVAPIKEWLAAHL